MNLRPDWDELANRGEARGADEVFETAKAIAGADGLAPERFDVGRDRRSTRVVALAAGLVIVGLGGVLLAAHASSGEPVVAGPASKAAPSNVQGPLVLGLSAPPAGYERTTSANQDASFIWAGPRGRLRVFQRVDGSGNVTGVQAVAVTAPGERTALDYLNTGPSSPQVTSRRDVALGDQPAVYAELTASPADSFGTFSVVRWTDSAGRTVTIAWRHRTLDEVLQTAQSLTPDADGGLNRMASDQGWMELRGADPVHVPIRADQMNQWAKYVSNDLAFTLGTATERWPAAADILWWMDGGRQVDASTAVGGDLAYHVDERGVAVVDIPNSADPKLAQDVISRLDLVTLASWSDAALRPAQPTTTSMAPSTTSPPG
ncbi:MAG: hypothetical protein JST64_11655 [Actinobacteria bacterium]|nr:hypothetical protein [Actinomycetota bacterium]